MIYIFLLRFLITIEINQYILIFSIEFKALQKDEVYLV